MLTPRLRPFGTTIFSEMTRLANEHGAINLAQGFPDFEGPPALVEAAVEALRGGHNQYSRSQGHPALVEAVAADRGARFGLRYDPMQEVAVFSGATEAIASTMLGLLSPGDEVLLFEPFYDSYPALAALAGATVRHYSLRAPDFAIDPDRLAALFSSRTKLVVLNTPHNPTGKVFTRDELELVARLCEEHGAVVLADEVYEHLTYDGVEHVSIATIPGMRERTVAVSSAGKSFSFTGWKIGWATGPAALIAAAQAAHQFVTFATATPLQLAVASALRTLGPDYYGSVRREFQARRDFLLGVLRAAGFEPIVPRGAYFIVAGFGRHSAEDDRAFARHMTAARGVAVIPSSPFYAAEPGEGRRLVRFAFCKRQETLERAAQRLRAMTPA
jgi:N-succinyldiaminopimelate aminotransferase